MANELKHASVGANLSQAEWESVVAHILDAQATGDLIYASSAAQLRRLGIGVAGQPLTVVGGIPAWGGDILLGGNNLKWPNDLGDVFFLRSIGRAWFELNFTALTGTGQDVAFRVTTDRNLDSSGLWLSLLRSEALASGTADSGSTTTLVDDALTQAEGYWNHMVLVILTTTNGLAPQGEIARVTSFSAALDRLTFPALTAAVEAGDTYALYSGDRSAAWAFGHNIGQPAEISLVFSDVNQQGSGGGSVMPSANSGFTLSEGMLTLRARPGGLGIGGEPTSGFYLDVQGPIRLQADITAVADLYMATSATAIHAPNATNQYIRFTANVTAGGLVEVGRLQGAADPYFAMGGSQTFRFTNAGLMGLFGATPAAQPAHIADPTGGTVIDAESRTAIAAINAMLATLGLTAAV